MERETIKRLPWVTVLLLLAVICTVSWLGALVIHKSSESDTFGSYRELAGAPNLEVQIAGDGFVFSDGDTLNCFDSRGKSGWAHQIGQGVQFNASAYGVAAWSGRKLTLINAATGTTTYSGEQDSDVVSARVGPKYAAVQLDTDTGSEVLVYEMGGQKIYTAQLEQTSVMDFGFFSSGSLLWVMALDTTGSVPTCEISTYKPRSMAIVGAIADTEQLMYSVTFQATSVCCTGVTYYKVYDYTGTEIESLRRLVYGWYLASADNTDDPMMAFVPTGQADGSGLMQDVRMMRSNLDQTVHMPFSCSALLAWRDRVYGFSGDGHVMVAKAGSQKADAYRMPFYIDRVYGVTDSNVAVVSSGTWIYLISLGEE